MSDRFDDIPDADEVPDYGGPWPHRDERAGKPVAKRFEWVDPSTMPVRQWVYARHLIRKFLSCTVAPGGVGKSSLTIVEALAMASGKDLIGGRPHGRFRVWLWNGEDPEDELQRRIMAAAIHHGLTREDVEGWLFVTSGRDHPIVLARQDRNGVAVDRNAVEMVRGAILGAQIDVVVIDPFVSCHAVNENDNGAINTVATALAEIADSTEVAIDAVHHARKTGGNEVTMEDLRGAVSLLSKARAARVLNVMTGDEAAKAGIEPHQRRLHFRVDSGKANLAPPPSEGSKWFRLESVSLGNGPPGLVDMGDSVGVVTPWEWPDPLANISVADLRKAQAAVAAGGRWRENIQARDWVGRPIAHALGLDPDDKAARDKVKRMLGIWIANKMFVVVDGLDEKSRPRAFVEVGEPAAD